MKIYWLILALLATVSSNALAAGWNENTDGDLSNSGLSPNVLNLDLGINSIIGNFGQGDRDYIAIIVPNGSQLEELRYGSGNLIGGVRSFIGVQAGSVMTVLPNANSATGLLGWAHPQDAADGTNFLPEIGQGFGAIGFVGPLVAGPYTFWVQDTSNESGLTYAWDFVVTTPVPEPESYAMIIAGLGLLSGMARMRKAS